MKPIDLKSIRAPVVRGSPADAPQQAASMQLKQEKPVKAKRPKLEYHSDFQHFGLTPELYASMPHGHKASTHEFHKEVLAGKHPVEHAKIKAATSPAAATAAAKISSPPSSEPDLKIVKSLDRLTSLFKNLKGWLQ